MHLTVKRLDPTNATDGAHSTFIYTVENKEVSTVTVTLDFTDGFNIKLENSPDLKVTSVIGPMSSDTVAVLRAYEESWANPCKAQVEKRSAGLEEQKTFIRQQVAAVEREAGKQENGVWKDFPVQVATVEQIKDKIRTLGNNANFIDVEFPPMDKSI